MAKKRDLSAKDTFYEIKKEAAGKETAEERQRRNKYLRETILLAVCSFILGAVIGFLKRL